MMITSSLYETSRRLFNDHPLASAESGDGDANQFMVLLLRGTDEANYFVLSQCRTGGRSEYSICPWPGGPAATIDTDGDGLVPVRLAMAVRQGTPLPRDGSLLGWVQNGIVTALIAVYTEWSPEAPEPCWSVMPRADSSRTQWPPFTDEALIGDWLWDFVEEGKVVSVDEIIAGTAETVFWADAQAVLGSGCCVVTHDLRSPGRYTLPSGCYVYHEALYVGARIPSVEELLTTVDRADLAARFN